MRRRFVVAVAIGLCPATACGGGGAEVVSAEEWVQGFCDAFGDLREDFDGPEQRLTELEATGFDDQGDALRSVDQVVDALDELRGLYAELVERATALQPEGEDGVELVAALRTARSESDAAFRVAADAFRGLDRDDPAELEAAFELVHEAPTSVSEAFGDLPDGIQTVLDGEGCEA